MRVGPARRGRSSASTWPGGWRAAGSAGGGLVAGRRFLRPARIRRRMALIAAVSTSTVVLAFCLPLAFAIRNFTFDRAMDRAEFAARTLAAELSVQTSPAAARSLVSQALAESNRQLTVILVTGDQLGAPLGRRVNVPSAILAGRDVTTAMADGGRLVWEPVRGGRFAVAVAARVPPDQLTQGMAGTWALLSAIAVLLVLLAVGLADRLGRSIVRPLLGLVTVTHRIRDGDIDCRSDPSGPYEVAEVGQAVNELADRIEALLASGRLAAADLGHRLRTPLTALRLHAEELADTEARRRLQHDIDVLEEAVSHLITQTRDAPPEVVAQADLAEAVRDRMAYWTVLARSQDRRADIRLPGTRADVAISRDELDAAIDALLSNVFIHTPQQTGFRVSLERRPGQDRPTALDRRAGPDRRGGLELAGRGQATWSLVVENAVPALAPALTAPVAPGTTSVTRPARNRGTGLGLDIVRRTALRAGGTVSVGPSASGGFRVEVRVPGTPAPAQPGDNG